MSIGRGLSCALQLDPTEQGCNSLHAGEKMNHCSSKRFSGRFGRAAGRMISGDHSSSNSTTGSLPARVTHPSQRTRPRGGSCGLLWRWIDRTPVCQVESAFRTLSGTRSSTTVKHSVPPSSPARSMSAMCGRKWSRPATDGFRHRASPRPTAPNTQRGLSI